MIFRILEDRYAQELNKAKAADLRFMDMALAFGRRGMGRTAPNPSVGAVIVKDGIVLGCGHTQIGGRPHAEVMALRQAGEAARGATLYVTLEPCSHFGKSPPCADAIISAGLARVVSAIEDPNPEVAGQGHARLKAAGIRVDVGLRRAEAARDHAGHFRRVRDGRPHVILKLAVSPDDRIGLPGRIPVAITGEDVRRRVHLLRAQCDAVLVGIGTAMADDPELTCRLPGMFDCSPIRVVLDRSLRLSGDSKLVHGARATPLWLVCGPTAEAASAAKLAGAGAHIIHVPEVAGGLDLHPALREFATRGITRLMVEGGAKVAASFVQAGLVDEVWLYRGGQPIGEGGVSALDTLPLAEITASPSFALRTTEKVGQDELTIYDRVS